MLEVEGSWRLEARAFIGIRRFEVGCRRRLEIGGWRPEHIRQSRGKAVKRAG